jgi:hypothetical protein
VGEKHIRMCAVAPCSNAAPSPVFLIEGGSGRLSKHLCGVHRAAVAAVLMDVAASSVIGLGAMVDMVKNEPGWRVRVDEAQDWILKVVESLTPTTTSASQRRRFFIEGVDSPPEPLYSSEIPPSLNTAAFSIEVTPFEAPMEPLVCRVRVSSVPFRQP